MQNFLPTFSYTFSLSLSVFAVPSKPQNLTVLDVSSTSITMSWHPPKNQNGAIAGYHVFHIHDNQTGVEIVKNSRNAAETLIHFELQSLSKYSCAQNTYTHTHTKESHLQGCDHFNWPFYGTSQAKLKQVALSCRQAVNPDTHAPQSL